MGLSLKLLTKVKYSITVHASGDIYLSDFLLEKKLAASDHVISESRYNKDYLLNLYGSKIASKIML